MQREDGGKADLGKSGGWGWIGGGGVMCGGCLKTKEGWGGGVWGGFSRQRVVGGF